MTASHQPVRVVVVGYGRYGQLHADAVRAEPGAQLVAVVDSDRTARERARERLGATVPVVASLDEVADADAVVVATPDRHHLAPATAAVARGCHVLVEKPVTTDVPAAAELGRRAAAHGVHVAVGHLLRFDPRLRWLREQVASGAWGPVVHMALLRNGAVELRETYRDVSPVLQGGVHDIDVAQWLAGRPIGTVTCEVARAPDGAAAFMTMTGRTALGCVVTVHAGRTLDLPMPLDPQTWMSLATPSVTVTIDGDHPVRVVGAPAPPTPLRAATPVEMLARQLEAFVDLVRGGPGGVLADLGDGARAVAVALAAERSAARGGVPIAADRPDEHPPDP